MTFAYYCLPIAMFLPLIFAGVAKVSASGYDNARPREWLEKLGGRAARANWAQENSYESFPPFAAAVIVAHLTGYPQMTVDILAGLYIVARAAYGYTYINDMPTARSLCWSVGFGITIALFLV